MKNATQKKERTLPDIRKEVGNVLDHWEQLSNDIRSDPGFSALDHALRLLYIAVERGEKPLDSRPSRKVGAR